MKLLVSDFDRTLYIDNKVSDANCSAVRQWQAQGNLLAIATGRNRGSIYEKLNAYDIQPDYWICNNGGDIYTKDWTLIAQTCICQEVAEQLIHRLRRNYFSALGVSGIAKNVKLFGFGQIDDRNGNDPVINYNELPCVGEIIQIAQKYTTGEITQAIAKELNQEYGDWIVAYPNVCNLDIVAKGVNKAAAITKLLALQPIEAVLTIGDSYNDREMIRQFHGYTVPSADLAIQQIASAVCADVRELIEKHC